MPIAPSCLHWILFGDNKTQHTQNYQWRIQAVCWVRTNPPPHAVAPPNQRYETIVDIDLWCFVLKLTNIWVYRKYYAHFTLLTAIRGRQPDVRTRLCICRVYLSSERALRNFILSFKLLSLTHKWDDKLPYRKPTDYEASILDSRNSELACKGYAAKAQSQCHPRITQVDQQMVYVSRLESSGLVVPERYDCDSIPLLLLHGATIWHGVIVICLPTPT